jgi:glutamine synthetase
MLWSYSLCRKVLERLPASVEDLPVWNYDGSSTGQAPGHDSEVLLKPARVFRDPFRLGENILVLCDTYQPLDDGSMRPLELSTNVKTWGVHGSNSRAAAAAIFSNPIVAAAQTWYGLEQEYTLFCEDRTTPLGWPRGGFPRPQGPYYCSAGVENAFGRDIADAHLQACLYAGVKISGTNAEVMPGQWEFQVGPCEGIEAGDHLWIARYLMQRVCEKYGVVVSFDPKPIREGDWNGAGCHTNFSTKDMRDPEFKYHYVAQQGEWAGRELSGGFAAIIEAVEKLVSHTSHPSSFPVFSFFMGAESRASSTTSTLRCTARATSTG